MKNFIVVCSFGLTACTTAQDACVSRANRDLAGLDAAIAVAEANIARGYGLEREVVTRNGFVFCSGTGFGTTVRFGLRTCSGSTLRTIETPVPLDIQAEERKLVSMQNRRVAAREQADRAIAACYAPE